MAERVEIVTITVPANTPDTNPFVQPLVWREGYPERVEIRIPPGPSGLVGIAFLHSGRRILPKTEGEWLITDNEPVIWPLEGYPYNANYVVHAYNDDIYDHTFQVRMLLNEVRYTGPVQRDDIDIVPPNVSPDSEMESPDFAYEPEEMPV